MSTDFKKWKAEPPIDEIELVVPGAPASSQSKLKKRETTIAAIQAAVAEAQYLISSDVQVEIRWRVHESLRYESDVAPDVDNTIKPILDGLTGPTGIIIDDCQVQALTVYWLDWNRMDQDIHVIIRGYDWLWLPKKSLRFVHLGKALCFPVNPIFPPTIVASTLDLLEMRLDAREKIMAATNDYSASQGVMPIQRLFHRSRLEGFEVVEIGDLRNEIADAAKNNPAPAKG